jgi:hypothetical protein
VPNGRVRTEAMEAAVNVRSRYLKLHRGARNHEQYYNRAA